jgi:large exoprotein involved in heme utilization and adhesion
MRVISGTYRGRPLKTIKGDATITTSVTDQFVATNGKTLTLGAGLVINSDDAVLYANGGKIVIDGAKISTSTSAYALACVDANSTLEVKSGSLTATANSVVGVINGGALVISGGVIEATSGTWVAAYTHEGHAGTITMTGGTVKAAGNAGLDANNKGTVTVTGGTVIGGVDKLEGGIVEIGPNADADVYVPSV